VAASWQPSWTRLSSQELNSFRLKKNNEKILTYELAEFSIFLPIAFLHFLNQFVNVELSAGILNQLLDGVFAAVHVQECAHNDGQTFGIDLADEYFDGLHQVGAVQVQDQVMNHVMAVTNNDQRELENDDIDCAKSGNSTKKNNNQILT
jgi:hypothetical protein